MSRSMMSKSRADKTSKEKEKDRGGSSSVPVPPVNTDVIPGRFTETDWHGLVDNEDSEAFVVDIVGDIVDSALNIIYDDYIQRQLYPYTIMQAKEAILQVVEWQFLARDEGEGDPETDPTWLEDDEPLPCVHDAWAQGSVPRQHHPPTSPTITEADTELTSVTPLSQHEIIDDDLATVNDTATLEEEDVNEQGKVEKKEGMSIEENETVMSSTSPKTQKLKAKSKFKPYKGRLKSAPLKTVESLEDTEKALQLKDNPPSPPTNTKDVLRHMPSSCHSILKVQAGRPPGSKDVTYDEKGNVVSIIKLDPEKLPTHRIKTKYKIVDPAVEAAHARLVAMRTGRFTCEQHVSSNKKQPTGYFETSTSAHNNVNYLSDGGRVTMPAGSSLTLASNNTITSQLKAAYEMNTNQAIITPLPPPLIESMELSPGVIVKEGNRIKKGPKQQMRHTDLVTSAKLRSLRPLASHIIDPQLAVTDILKSQTPVLRPLHSTDPIPPITSRTAVHSN